MTTTFETLKQLMLKKYSLDEDRITPEATLESLALDSLDVIELLFDVEDAFKIRIPQEAGPSLRSATVQDVVNSIDQIIGQKAEPPAARTA